MYLAGDFLCGAVMAFVVRIYYFIILLCAAINTPSNIFQTREIIPDSHIIMHIAFFRTHHTENDFNAHYLRSEIEDFANIRRKYTVLIYTCIWISMSEPFYPTGVFNNAHMKLYLSSPFWMINVQMWHNVHGWVLTSHSLAKPCNLQTYTCFPEIQTKIFWLYKIQNVWYRFWGWDFVLLLTLNSQSSAWYHCHDPF